MTLRPGRKKRCKRLLYRTVLLVDSSMQTGAESVLQAAAAAGVSVCFANPGTTEMHFVQALDRADGKIRPVLCLHETVATGAADGYARMTRLPAMTLLHLGPGLANGAKHPLGLRDVCSSTLSSGTSTLPCMQGLPTSTMLGALAAR